MSETASVQMERVGDGAQAVPPAETAFTRRLAMLRAAGEPTRLRLLALLDALDLTVSDLTAILDQSQPRISRHLKLLVDAGLVGRFQEGAWAYFRAAGRGVENGDVRALVEAMLHDIPLSPDDVAHLNSIRDERAKLASDYFAANAAGWGAIRALHTPEAEVEREMLALGLAHAPRSLMDLGTGTGRILELFAPSIDRGVGVDTSRDMLAVARTALSATPHLHVRHGDVYEVPTDGGHFDLVVLHQVLHFLEDPAAALAQAAGRMAAGGRILVVDFAAHDAEFLREQHAHRRLGLSEQQMENWATGAGLEVVQRRALPAPEGLQPRLTVMLWLLAARA